jgi:hypothetical protein
METQEKLQNLLVNYLDVITAKIGVEMELEKILTDIGYPCHVYVVAGAVELVLIDKDMMLASEMIPKIEGILGLEFDGCLVKNNKLISNFILPRRG